MGYYIWLIKMKCYYYYKHEIPWIISGWIPKKIMLLIFVRVYGIMGECGPEFDYITKSWERKYNVSV